jgi:hypothetical protein
MKKILITIGLAVLTCSSQAQGTLNFVNSAATIITLSSNSVFLGAAPNALGGFRYELFFGPAGTTAANLLNASGVIATNTGTAGRFSAGSNLAIPGLPAGGTAAIMVRGWSSNLGANYAAAKINWDLGLPGFLGQSAVAPNFLTGGGAPIAILASPVFGGASGIVPLSGTTGFTMFHSTPVPEPTSMALAGIGAAAMLIFRRRNK